jgi:ABC-type multidrug transport system ATPase subunit
MDVRTEQLTVEFPGGIRAVDQLSVHVEEGEQVALLGPSGSGKSTLLRALLGAVRATGRVRIGGHDPYRDAQAIRAATGFVRQGNDLVLGVSARLNALMGTSTTWHVRDWLRALSGRTPARHCTGWLVRTGLSVACPSRPGGYPAGKRQRVALVRALIANPRLPLADEPTSGLHPVTAEAAMEALLGVGVTPIVATHDLAVARRFPRILAIRAGTLVYDGLTLDDQMAGAIYAGVSHERGRKGTSRCRQPKG